MRAADKRAPSDRDRVSHISYRRPIAVDLFSGVGGLSLGFEQAGFDVVASVEYDPVHAAVHSYNFPLTSIICADVASVSGDRLLDACRAGFQAHEGRTWSGEIDVIVGGPPCQGFSFIGKRLIADKRNRLVFHFLRIVAELRPRFFVMENVPGMTVGGHSSILAELIVEFGEVGYCVIQPPRTLNAADFGVPQDRRRLFLVGARADQCLPDYPSPTVRRAGKNGKLEMPLFAVLPTGPAVWDALRDLPDADRYEELVGNDEVRISRKDRRNVERKASDYVRKLRGMDEDDEDLSYPREWDPNLLTGSMRTRHAAESIRRFRKTASGEVESVSRFLRLDPKGLCNTLRAGTGSERGAFTSPRPIHPRFDRVLTVREAARLHSFPDWFRLHRTKWHGFRGIGNAVPPLLARAVARELIRVLDANPQRPTRILSLGDPKLLEMNLSEAAACFQADPESLPERRFRKSP